MAGRVRRVVCGRLQRWCQKHTASWSRCRAADSIGGQILELKNMLDSHADFPVALIGHSWGAWLSYIYTAAYPEDVKKLILIGSGAFEKKYVTEMRQARTSRLTESEAARMQVLFQQLSKAGRADSNVLREFGELASKADSYAPIAIRHDTLDFQTNVFHRCMEEINAWRSSGRLLQLGRQIHCPVLAIHGKNDSHPYEGVEKTVIRCHREFPFYTARAMRA